MNKQFKILFAIAIFAAMGMTALYAENIGYVDMQKVFMKSEDAKKAQIDFKAKQDKYQQEFEKRQKEIEKAKKDKKSDEEIQKIITKFESELDPQQKELMKLNQELTEQLRSKIIKQAEKAAKKYGIDIVLDHQFVLYGGFDLTDVVITQLNK